MKRIRLLAVVLASVLFLASAAAPAAAEEGKKLNIVTTICPVYDWILQAAGGADHAEITLLLDSGGSQAENESQHSGQQSCAFHRVVPPWFQ